MGQSFTNNRNRINDFFLVGRTLGQHRNERLTVEWGTMQYIMALVFDNSIYRYEPWIDLGNCLAVHLLDTVSQHWLAGKGKHRVANLDRSSTVWSSNRTGGVRGKADIMDHNGIA